MAPCPSLPSIARARDSEGSLPPSRSPTSDRGGPLRIATASSLRPGPSPRAPASVGSTASAWSGVAVTHVRPTLKAICLETSHPRPAQRTTVSSTACSDRLSAHRRPGAPRVPPRHRAPRLEGPRRRAAPRARDRPRRTDDPAHPRRARPGLRHCPRRHRGSGAALTRLGRAGRRIPARTPAGRRRTEPVFAVDPRPQDRPRPAGGRPSTGSSGPSIAQAGRSSPPRSGRRSSTRHWSMTS